MDYDKIHTVYDECYAPGWPLDQNSQIINFLKTWPGGNNILELGVGSGNVAGKLYLNGYHNITGIDRNSNMLEIAKLKCPKVNLRLGDIREVNFHSYDWVIAIASVLIDISNSDKKLLFRKMYEELPTGSYVFIGTRRYVYHPGYQNEAKVESTIKNSVDTYFINDKHQWRGKDCCEGRVEYINILHPEKSASTEYTMWVFTNDDLVKTMTDIGFKYISTGKREDTGYFQDVWVFQK